MSELQARGLGIVFALIFGLGVPLFLVGPWLFNSIPFGHLSKSAVLSAGVCAFLGLWLAVVSVFASAAELKKVLEPFAGTEALILFLPYILFVGTRSVWRRLVRKQEHEKVANE
jgi:hypothetical protein